MHILGIETSCDETSASVVRADKTVLSNVVFSQIESHKVFGGVVPEIGARAHLEKIQPIILQALQEANMAFNDLSAIAATCGPGLIGGVLVGAVTAKAIAAYHQKPFLAINHLEAHALSPRLTEEVPFPYLLLLASGGHCQIIHVKDLGNYQILGSTLDDAAGECFDKAARLLGFDYPGGPAIEKAAKKGDPKRFAFPRPLCQKPGYDFSFSGLKTAVLRKVEEFQPLVEQDTYDMAASFQQAVFDVFANRLRHVLKSSLPFQHVVIAGGVTANQFISQGLKTLVEHHGRKFVAPPLKYCTDNGAMVAWAGLERFQRGFQSPLSFKPRPRWPLTDMRLD